MRRPGRSAAPLAAGLALVAALALLPAPGAARAAPGGPPPATGVPAGWRVAPLPHVDQAHVRAELARVLDSPELRGGRQRGATTLVASLWVRAQAWLERQPAGFTRGVVIACLLVLLAVGAHLVYSVRAVLRGERRAAGVAAAEDRRRSAAELRALAGGAAGQGDFAGGVRLLYLAALEVLAERGVCAVAAGTADWTVVDRCGAAPEVAAPLHDLVTAFQRSRFGGAACDRAAFDRCQAWLDAIAGAAPAGAAGGAEAGR